MVSNGNISGKQQSNFIQPIDEANHMIKDYSQYGHHTVAIKFDSDTNQTITNNFIWCGQNLNNHILEFWRKHF